jgi:hypothetical protein
MKKFAALLMLVCSLGVFAVVGCGDTAKKPDTKPSASPDKMAPAASPAPASK